MASPPEDSSARPGWTQWLAVIPGVILIGGLLIGLTLMLMAGADELEEVALPFISKTRSAGAPPYSLKSQDNVDAEAALDAIRTSTSQSFGNYHINHRDGRDTACLWATLEGNDGSWDVVFFFETDGDLWHVSDIALKRDCYLHNKGYAYLE